MLLGAFIYKRESALGYFFFFAFLVGNSLGMRPVSCNLNTTIHQTRGYRTSPSLIPGLGKYFSLPARGGKEGEESCPEGRILSGTSGTSHMETVKNFAGSLSSGAGTGIRCSPKPEDVSDPTGCQIVSHLPGSMVAENKPLVFPPLWHPSVFEMSGERIRTRLSYIFGPRRCKFENFGSS